jgi:hypothetical protein
LAKGIFLTVHQSAGRARLEQVLGQVEDRGADRVVHRVAPGVGRPAQRDDQDIEAAALERGDLLRDERLGEARIPLEYERDPQQRPAA